jgi:predicted RNA-binding protein
LRRSDGTLLDKSFKANYEDFIKAMDYASDNYSYGGDIKFTEESPAISGKNVLEVVGINLKGDKIIVVDILWSSNELSETVSLNKRINKKRIKIKRKWSEGITNETIWSLTTGSKIRMSDNSFSSLANFKED